MVPTGSPAKHFVVRPHGHASESGQHQIVASGYLQDQDLPDLMVRAGEQNLAIRRRDHLGAGAGGIGKARIPARFPSFVMPLRAMVPTTGGNNEPLVRGPRDPELARRHNGDAFRRRRRRASAAATRLTSAWKSAALAAMSASLLFKTPYSSPARLRPPLPSGRSELPDRPAPWRVASAVVAASARRLTRATRVCLQRIDAARQPGRFGIDRRQAGAHQHGAARRRQRIVGPDRQRRRHVMLQPFQDRQQPGHRNPVAVEASPSAPHSVLQRARSRHRA